MKLETILDAMVATACGNMNWKQARRIRAKRQYHAFRARILREFRTKEIYIELLQQAKELGDARIAELEEEVERLELRIDNIAWDLRRGG